MLDIKIKFLHKDAVMPTKAYEYDAGFDLTAVSKKETENYIQYGTGIAMHIPKNYVGLLFPRSSVTDKDLILKNSIGVIDSGYLGEIKFRFQNLKNKDIIKIDTGSMSVDNTKKLIDDYNKTGILDMAVRSIDKSNNDYNIGDRIGQIVFLKIPEVSFIKTDDLGKSERGKGGYGSSNKK